MAYLVKYENKDENFDIKELRFVVRSSAEEEAERLREYGHNNVDVITTTEGNLIGLLIQTIGILVIIIGAVVGFVQGNISLEYSGDFSLLVALYWWLSAIIIGILLIGFAEVIKLLDQINRKLSKKEVE